jgi:hypothetical protein
MLGSGGIATGILDFGTKWSGSRSGRFTPGKVPPITHLIGGSMGRRAGLDMVAKRKTPSPAGNRTLIVQPVVKEKMGLNKEAYQLY